MVIEEPPPSAAGRPAFDARSLAAAVGGRLLRDSSREIRGGAVDSRRVQAGNAFFALPGDRTDGHEFLAQAVAAGAAALVVTRPPPAQLEALTTAGDVAVLAVPDGLAALAAAARAWRTRFAPVVVGITGSLAKTSTKEQVAEVLEERWTVLRNTANENNEIGLPLTLLRLAPEHEVAVLEMGMYVPGDIRALAELASPLVGVVTAVRGTHLSRAGSIEAIERGKAELVEALPTTGTAVLNADDPLVARMAGRLPAGVRALLYGFSPEAQVTAVDVQSRAEQGMRFVLRGCGRDVLVESPALGRHGVHNALAAAAVGKALGLDSATIGRGLARPFSAPHRSVLHDLGAWRVLDDTYNAAPDSMVAALDLLAGLPGRRLAVLGEMLELGDGSREAHRQVGRHAAACADVLLCVGETAAAYGEGARAAGLEGAAVHEVGDQQAAYELLLETLRPGDVVLLKGSRGVALDLLVERLLSAAGELRGGVGA
ncbi:MAG TPA: UDP-N-acetylmuramoyl-tripeptide--D-alanyl-D-alanine ligase [Candidatus Limnocylindria bacterium]|nr:UDP-N-acetylmuramoyl-tripeptide--D-alanyl-D-alanine ligase [Candidatus Limnocylindria bacterium]